MTRRGGVSSIKLEKSSRDELICADAPESTIQIERAESEMVDGVFTKKSCMGEDGDG